MAVLAVWCFEWLLYSVPSNEKFEAIISCNFWSIPSRSPCISFNLFSESQWPNSCTQTENLLGSLSSTLSKDLPPTHVLRSLTDTSDTEGRTRDKSLTFVVCILSVSLLLVCLSLAAVVCIPSVSLLLVCLSLTAVVCIPSVSLLLVCLSFFICHISSCKSRIPANCLLLSASLMIGLMSVKHEVSLLFCVAFKRGVLCRHFSCWGRLSSR